MNKLTRNYFSNLLFQLLNVALPLITSPYLARILGADRIGEYSYIQSIVSYFAMFAIMGTSIYGQRKIAQCIALSESLRKPFFEIVILRTITTVCFLGLYFATIFPGMENRILTAIAAIEILCVAFDISWFFQGIEEFQTITICNGIAKLTGAACIFLFVKTKADLELYVGILLGCTLAGNISQWFFAFSKINGEKCAGKRLVPHILPALHLFISQIAIQTYTVLDKTMIGLITHSNVENGYYDLSQHLIRALVAIITSIGAVMASRIAIIWHKKDADYKKDIQDLMMLSFRLVFAVGIPITVGILIIASRFVPIYYGEGNDPIIQLLHILAFIVPIIGCSNIIGIQLFVPSGREKLLTKSVIIGALINVAFNAVMIPKYAAVGAAIASVIAELTVTGVQLFFIRKEIDIKKLFFIFIRYLLFSIVMGGIGIGLLSIVANNIIGTVIIVGACAISYGLLVLVSKDPVLRIFRMK